MANNVERLKKAISKVKNFEKKHNLKKRIAKGSKRSARFAAKVGKASAKAGYKATKKSVNYADKKYDKIASKFSSGPRLLTHVKAKGPTPISAKKTLKSFADNTGPLVREAIERDRTPIPQDTSSQFFNQAWIDEENDSVGWL